MSKRNFILLTIILIIAIIIFFGFLYFNQSPTVPGEVNNGTNFISQFNPFGNNKPKPPATTTPVDNSGNETGTTTPTTTAKLIKVSSMPVAGFTVFSKERLKDVPIPAPVTPSKKTTKSTPPLTEFMPALKYVERATGNIYETFADKIEEKKFSTTVIPMVYEAFFGNKGNSVIMRYLKADAKTIITFVSALPKELLGADPSASNEIKGSFLPEDIKDVSLSTDTLSLFYLFSSGDGVVGNTYNLSTSKKVQVFDSPFTEWLSSFPISKMITFTTKPSSGIPGYMYTMDPTNKNYNLHEVLGNINGLTTNPSPNGKLVLYSNDSLSLNIYHLDTKVSDALGIKTLAEKCVWNKTSDTVYCGVPKSIAAGQYPDSWYQGEVSFGDQIWKIDVKTDNATMIVDPATMNNGEPASPSQGGDIDSIKLALDDGENYLFFVNKKDSFLWELALK